MKDTRRQGLSVVGFGAAACVACCVGPILAFLGGLSIAGLASTLVVGGVGLVITAGAVVALIVLLRRRSATVCTSSLVAPVAVAAPTRKSPVPSQET